MACSMIKKRFFLLSVLSPAENVVRSFVEHVLSDIFVVKSFNIVSIVQDLKTTFQTVYKPFLLFPFDLLQAVYSNPE
jgi:hypothetical protein